MIKLALSLVFLLFVLGCSNVPVVIEEQETVLCSPPYFEFRAGECCLDENNNEVCDAEEVPKFPEEKGVVVPDVCDAGNYFECTDINIQNDPLYGGSISFDLKLMKFGSAVITKIEFPQLGCSYEQGQWSIEDGVMQTPKSFRINCPFGGDVLLNKFVDSDMVISMVYYDQVRQGVDSTWDGVYDVKDIIVVGQISGGI
jgi:hypothetical protein